MIGTLWKTLEYIQNYSKITIELWELSIIVQRLTQISWNVDFSGN